MHVSTNRPSLDIELVATGETWLGPDALAKGLCDEAEWAAMCGTLNFSQGSMSLVPIDAVIAACAVLGHRVSLSQRIS